MQKQILNESKISNWITCLIKKQKQKKKNKTTY